MKTFDQIREGFVSAAQRKAVWASKADGGKGHPDNKKEAKSADLKPEKYTDANGKTKIRMVPVTREDTSDAVKAFLAKGGKIKKLPPAKAQGYHGKDDPGKGMHGMMDKPDTKQMGTRKKVKSMEGVEEARAPRMKYALIGAKDMKIYSTGSDERDLKLDRRSLEKRFNQPLKLARLKTAQRIGDKVDKSQIKEAKRTVTINKPDRLTSMRVSKDKPPFDNPKPMQKDTKDKFGNPIKNRAKHLARKAAKDLLNKAK